MFLVLKGILNMSGVKFWGLQKWWRPQRREACDL